MTSSSNKTAQWAIGFAAFLLFCLHQDVWFWHQWDPMVFGFIPIGLAYHAMFSIAAALLWAGAMHWAWPFEIEAMAEEVDEGGDSV